MSFKESRIQVLFIVSLIVYSFCQVFAWHYGERVPEYAGLGYDGHIYASWVSNFSFLDYFKHNLPPYYVQRILPSVIVHYGMLLFNLDIQSTVDILFAFTVYNNILLLMMTIGLFRLAMHLKWTPEATFVAFVTFAFSTFSLKGIPSYPVLTDCTMLVLGFYQIYFYIKRNTLGLLCATILGAFTVQTLLYVGLMMFILRLDILEIQGPNPSEAYYENKTVKQLFRILGLIFLLSLTIAQVIQSTFLDVTEFLTISIGKEFKPSQVQQPGFMKIFLNIFSFLLFYAYFLMPLLKVILRQTLNAKALKNMVLTTLLSILLIFAMHFFIAHVADTTTKDPVTFYHLILLPFYRTQNFLAFFKNYFATFSIGALLFILLYPKMKLEVLRLNFVTLVFLFVTFISFEIRGYTNFFAIIPIMLGAHLTASGKQISFEDCVAFLLLSFICSGGWLPNLHQYTQSTNLFIHNIHFILIILGASCILIRLFSRRAALFNKTFTSQQLQEPS